MERSFPRKGSASCTGKEGKRLRVVWDKGQLLGMGKEKGFVLWAAACIKHSEDNSENPRAPTKAVVFGARWEILWLVRGSPSTMAQQFLLCVHNTGFHFRVQQFLQHGEHGNRPQAQAAPSWLCESGPGNEAGHEW